MDQRNKLRFLPWAAALVVVGVLAALFVLQARSRTSVLITSIEADVPRVGDQVSVGFRVMSGQDDFTVVVLPDTQYYSEKYPEIYAAQVQWILDNAGALNIVFVSHLGDIVQNDDLDETEWQTADAFMRRLDDAAIPYGVLPGNHDMQADGTAIFYEKYFPASRYAARDWYGGSFSGNKNNYQLFSAGGDDYIIFHMQYCPTSGAIEWANEILGEYPDRRAIVSTHAYLTDNGERLMHCKEKSDGTVTANQMWHRLVERNPNVFLVLAGHVPGAIRRADVVDGRTVHQLLSDYQAMENGGNGYLRIMSFQPRRDLIQVSTFSPYLNEFMEDPENQFELSFDMTGGGAPTGSVKISNGADRCSAAVEQGRCELILTSDGELTFSAVYSGDARHLGASSAAVRIFVAER
jgi:hypothetical protein